MGSMQRPVRGADAIQEIVTSRGTRTVFSLSGAQHSAVLDAFERSGSRIVGGRTESGVVGTADGYARVSGRPGLALIISGQGLVNAVAGLACAYLAASPVVVLVACPPLDSEEAADELRSATGYVEPVAKWVRTVRCRERLIEFLEMALTAATTGRPGPAVLAIPSDLLWEEGEGVSRGRLRYPGVVPGAMSVDPVGLGEVVEVLVRCQRPVCVVGPTARFDGVGRDDLLRLATAGFPIVAEGAGRGILAEDFEGCFSWPVAQTAVARADFVLAVGGALGRNVNWLRAPWSDPGAFVTGVTRSAETVTWGRLPDKILLGEMSAVVDGLTEGARRHGWYPELPSWMGRALGARLDAISHVGDESADGLNPIAIARRLMTALTQPAVFVGDGADVLSWAHTSIRLAEGSTWLDHRPLGSMGTALPLAIGAAAAEAEAQDAGLAARPVVLLTGDGALGYQLAELETMARCQLPVSVVVANDGAWGTEYHAQERTIGRTIGTRLTQARYDLVAEGLGCRGALVRDLGELDAALQGMCQDTTSPMLLNVLTGLDGGRVRKEQPLLQMVYHDDVMLRHAQGAEGDSFAEAQGVSQMQWHS